jgi:O-antigen/teichoic acid export membrane protein
MYFTHSIVWAVAGLALGRLLVLLTWDTRLGFAGHTASAPAARLEWKSEEMLAMLRMALPLGFVSMLNALNTSVPRYFIEAHWGSAELGIFSAIASLMSAGSLIVSAFGQSILVPVARACDASDRSEFRGFVLQAIALGAVLGGGAVAAAGLFGRQILTQLFRPEYAANNDIFFRLMVAGTVMFIACGLGFVMTAARSLKPQLPLLLLTVLAAAAVAAYSIPTNGLRGAADAALASALVQLAGSVLILLRIDRQLKKDSSPKFDMYVPATAESEALEATTR